jgi:hypothetical protein
VGLKLSTDIVMDVVAAADPARANMAQARLKSGASIQAVSETSFAEALSQAGTKRGIARVLDRDIVADVVRAADPQKALASARKLSAGPVELATLMPGAGAPVGVREHAVPADTPAGKAAHEFEAVFLRNAVEQLLPKGENSLFGSGTAGTMWRSLAAEQLSNQLALADGTGIAGLVFEAMERARAAQGDGPAAVLPAAAEADMDPLG